MSEGLMPHRYEPVALASESAVVAGLVPEPGVREALGGDAQIALLN